MILLWPVSNQFETGHSGTMCLKKKKKIKLPLPKTKITSRKHVRKIIEVQSRKVLIFNTSRKSFVTSEDHIHNVGRHVKIN